MSFLGQNRCIIGVVLETRLKHQNLEKVVQKFSSDWRCDHNVHMSKNYRILILRKDDGLDLSVEECHEICRVQAMDKSWDCGSTFVYALNTVEERKVLW